MTGAPVKILVGDKDDYDAPDACQRLSRRAAREPGARRAQRLCRRVSRLDGPTPPSARAAACASSPTARWPERSRRETVEFFAQAFASRHRRSRNLVLPRGGRVPAARTRRSRARLSVAHGYNGAVPAPEFVAVGHVTLDRFGGEVRPGGAALYAAVTPIAWG